MNALEVGLNKLLSLVNKLQPAYPNNNLDEEQDNDIHIEIQTYNAISQ